jgi:hypothetical protein
LEYFKFFIGIFLFKSSLNSSKLLLFSGFKYKIDVNKLDDEFNEMYRDEIRKAYKKIDDTREEVEAQLSLSDDLKYQQEVLERYNIISKKTKKISD